MKKLFDKWEKIKTRKAISVNAWNDEQNAMDKLLVLEMMKATWIENIPGEVQSVEQLSIELKAYLRSLHNP